MELKPEERRKIALLAGRLVAQIKADDLQGNEDSDRKGSTSEPGNAQSDGQNPPK